jgi:ATP-binding protein involved in chromosome partitioning
VTFIMRQFVERIVWPELSYLVVDLPPGTSAVQHVLVEHMRPDGALIVVTPDVLAHLDGWKAAQMFRTQGIAVLGGVENMSAVTCPHCGHALALFQPAAPERSLWSMGVERLVQIPFDPAVAAFKGDANTSGAKLFDDLAATVVVRVTKR